MRPFFGIICPRPVVPRRANAVRHKMIRTDIPHGLPPRRAVTPCTKKPFHIPRTRACVAWAEHSEAHKGEGRRLRRGERSEPRKGGKAPGGGKPAQMGKRGGASATNGSTNPGGLSVSAYGRGRAAGARKEGRRLRPARGEGAQAGREERADARNRGAPQRLDRYISTGRRAAGARCARPTDTIGSPRPSAESRGRGRIRRAATTTCRMGYTPHGLHPAWLGWDAGRRGAADASHRTASGRKLGGWNMYCRPFAAVGWYYSDLAGSMPSPTGSNGLLMRLCREPAAA